MRDREEIIAELDEKLGRITQDEDQMHQEARRHFRDARDLLEKARDFHRYSSNFDDDHIRRESLASAYSDIASAFEQAARVHQGIADGLVRDLAYASREVAIRVKED